MSILEHSAYRSVEIEPGVRRYEISWSCDAANGVVSGSVLGGGGSSATGAGGRDFTVARVSQGLYRITFSAGNSFARVLCQTATLEIGTPPVARFLQMGVPNIANRTIDIRVTDAAGAVQDLPAVGVSTSKIHVDLLLDGSGLVI